MGTRVYTRRAQVLRGEGRVRVRDCDTGLRNAPACSPTMPSAPWRARCVRRCVHRPRALGEALQTRRADSPGAARAAWAVTAATCLPARQIGGNTWRVMQGGEVGLDKWGARSRDETCLRRRERLTQTRRLLDTLSARSPPCSPCATTHLHTARSSGESGGEQWVREEGLGEELEKRWAQRVQWRRIDPEREQCVQ